MVIIKIICLDQATKITGYSIFEDKQLIIYGTLEVDQKEKNYIERIRQMYFKIKELISSNSPDFVVFEGVQYQNNFNTYLQLGNIQGVIMAYLFELNIGFQIIEPSAWKSFCSIKGKKREEQKKNTQKFVKDKFGLDVSEDTADAIGIGVWAINKINIII